MRSSGYIRFALDLVAPVATVSEFPVVSKQFGHDARTADKRHDDHPHIFQIDIRGIAELLLSPDRELFGCFRQINDFFPGIFDPAEIGIDFQRIKGPAFEKFFPQVGTAGNDLKAFTVSLQEGFHGFKIFAFKIGS